MICLPHAACSSGSSSGAGHAKNVAAGRIDRRVTDLFRGVTKKVGTQERRAPDESEARRFSFRCNGSFAVQHEVNHPTVCRVHLSAVEVNIHVRHSVRPVSQRRRDGFLWHIEPGGQCCPRVARPIDGEFGGKRHVERMQRAFDT